MKLKDKVALVTGASRGIAQANAVVKTIEKLGRKAIAIQADVADEKQVKAMVEKSLAFFGQIDILVNNAGIVYDVPLFERSVEQWKRTLDVNLLGNFLCSKYASKQMLKKTGGKIINISSTNAINSFSPDAIDYDASKAGVITLTKDFAKELAP